MTDFRDSFFSHTVYVVFRANGVICFRAVKRLVGLWEAKPRDNRIQQGQFENKVCFRETEMSILFSGSS